MPRNPNLRSLRLDYSKLEDAAVGCLARPGLHELTLLNCGSLSGRLLRELTATCRDLRVLSLNSGAERRDLAMVFSDLEALLNGCSNFKAGIIWNQYLAWLALSMNKMSIKTCTSHKSFSMQYDEWVRANMVDVETKVNFSG